MKNSLYDFAISSGHFQQVGCKIRSSAFLIKCYRTFNIKCWNKVVFLISQMKLIKLNERLEPDLDIELERAVLSTVSVSRGEIWNKLRNSILNKAEQKSSKQFFILLRLKMYPCQGGKKLFRPVYYPVPLLVQTTP